MRWACGGPAIMSLSSTFKGKLYAAQMDIRGHRTAACMGCFQAAKTGRGFTARHDPGGRTGWSARIRNEDTVGSYPVDVFEFSTRDGQSITGWSFGAITVQDRRPRRRLLRSCYTRAGLGRRKDVAGVDYLCNWRRSVCCCLLRGASSDFRAGGKHRGKCEGGRELTCDLNGRPRLYPHREILNGVFYISRQIVAGC